MADTPEPSPAPRDTPEPARGVQVFSPQAAQNPPGSEGEYASTQRVWVGGVVGGRSLGPIQRLLVGLLAIAVVTIVLVIIVPLALLAVLLYLAFAALTMIRNWVAETVGHLTGTLDDDAPGRRNVRVRDPARAGPGDGA